MSKEPMAVIRRANALDVEAVQQLNHELFLSDNRFNGDLITQWPFKEGQDYFSKGISEDSRLILVAEVDDTVVGYLYGRITQPHPAETGKRAELDNMCITSAYRSQGIGAQLVSGFKKWAVERKVNFLIVTAFAGNEGAIDFYERTGFTPYGVTLWHKLPLPDNK